MKRAQNSSVFCVWSQIILFQKSKISSQKILDSCHRQSEASGSGSPGSLGRKVGLRRSAGDGFQCSADGWRLRAVIKTFGFDFPSGQANVQPCTWERKQCIKETWLYHSFLQLNEAISQFWTLGDSPGKKKKKNNGKKERDFVSPSLQPQVQEDGGPALDAILISLSWETSSEPTPVLNGSLRFCSQCHNGGLSVFLVMSHCRWSEGHL